ncbi:hypothetical protein SAY86_010084 [Trapa natans]|uniref:RING-type E3 ubiquitin transferase n=1 Tax=Trapa natans TaxID=22666 RepID=A0AAN7KZP2_TRANT|nr:hypothetical protein SAY86_010084 [Trapa natans]
MSLIQQKDGILTHPPPPYISSLERDAAASSPSPPSSSGPKISPAVLFIIIILAVLFFISGLLHLLVRFLSKKPSSSASPSSRRYPEISSSDALQRQLQQLFHLHDSGLDQAFIDALPVFHYKEIVGVNEPFDCAVCLCEFTEKDKLRLLPMCSHAFHINCIDTWLLSNSTCPLCRGTLFGAGFSIENPIFDYDGSREEDGSYPVNETSAGQKTVDIEEVAVEKRVLPVRLGKFRKLNNDLSELQAGETSSSNLDARRCFSMGSYQYVVVDSDLRVPLSNGPDGNRTVKKAENGGDSSADRDVEAKKINRVAKGESYSVSKIWLWSRKGKYPHSSEQHVGMPSSLKIDLPWAAEAVQEKT